MVASPRIEQRASSAYVVAAYRHLCARGVRKFVRPGLERSDLEQVAALGLIKASRRYDASTGTPFEAYAWNAILGELMHYVRDHEHAIRMPRRLLAIERLAGRTRGAIAAAVGREPSDAEIASALGIPLAALRDVRAARDAVRTASLDATPLYVRAPSSAVDIEDRLLIAHGLSTLGLLERRIVRGVYFLGLTQSQLALALHLSPKRVSRIHLGALATLRRAWAA